MLYTGDMNISLEMIFIALVFISLILYWIFNFVILYHLERFGVGTQPKKMAAVFLFGAVVLFFSCTILFANLDLKNLNNKFKNYEIIPFNFYQIK